MRERLGVRGIVSYLREPELCGPKTPDCGLSSATCPALRHLHCLRTSFHLWAAEANLQHPLVITTRREYIQALHQACGVVVPSSQSCAIVSAELSRESALTCPPQPAWALGSSGRAGQQLGMVRLSLLGKRNNRVGDLVQEELAGGSADSPSVHRG